MVQRRLRPKNEMTMAMRRVKTLLPSCFEHCLLQTCGLGDPLVIIGDPPRKQCGLQGYCEATRVRECMWTREDGKRKGVLIGGKSYCKPKLGNSPCAIDRDRQPKDAIPSDGL